MAGQNITVVLKTANSDGSGTNSDVLHEADFHENQDELAKSRKQLAKAAVEQAAMWAVQETMSIVTYDINNYVSLTENYKLQVKMDNVSTTINKVTSLASSTISGAITGAQIGGGVGAVVGAVVAIVGSTISTATDLMKQYASQNLALASSDIQANFTHSRLGLVDNGRGTQN